jgi:serine/threonine protein phosphatase PrpC
MMLSAFRRHRSPQPTADYAPPPGLNSVALTHVGRVRRVNEDRVLDCPERGLWAVADGMGGHSAGDVAATIVVRALAGLTSAAAPISADTIEAALQQANRAIGATDTGSGVSGSTIAGLHIDRDTFHVFWAGDSRVYRYRDGVLTQLSHDHSLVQELVDAQALPAESAASHPRANVITRALGVGPVVELECRTGTLQHGDRFLLCSDGLSGQLSDASMSDLLTSPIDEAARALVEAALAAGGHDNLSVVLVDYSGGNEPKAR